ncbi:hypothetical protein [Nocardioides sp. URHA0032]|uniref:hypothetical protein n=1 Tax=Nocardioides sp. URHA0032 TaxID=1380388 RepID=UPI0012DCEB36|nr:hypothetical protein [Nocardioides sp. URHA0032]
MRATAAIFGFLVTLAWSGAFSDPADASTGPTAPAAQAAAASAASVAEPALTSSAKNVEEGDRYTLTATLRSAATATRATLEKWHPSLYGWDPAGWDPVKAVKVGHRGKVPFKLVAADLNSERYRVAVAYKKTAKPAVSRPVTVTVWRWIPLSEYDPYYTTGGTGFGTTTINGVAYTGWGAATYSHAGTWESRFTPGRHCKSFTAVLGVGDISADGSSATISFTADDEHIYTSSTLTPGMSAPVTVALPMLPYRFGIQLLDTTPGATTDRDAVESWPVLGAPAFLCTGV